MSLFKPQKDKQIGDKYILLEFLGDGSYGYVWKTKRLEDDKIVALKIPKNQESGDKVLKEGGKLQEKTHPNIIDINWMGRVDGVFVIEMEYFEGTTLGDEIRKHGTIQPRLFSNIYDIFFQVLEAIKFMHSLKICHGDIKPDNILLGHKVKITDFGTSRLIEDLFVETLGEGTCGFIAPEVVNSKKRYLASDIYSLGALLYFLLTGKKAYGSLVQVVNNTTYKKPREINSNIPKKVEHVILKALSRKPGNRYEDVEELQEALREAITSREKRISVESYYLTESKADWMDILGKLYKNNDWQKAEEILSIQLQKSSSQDVELHLAYIKYKQEQYFNSLKILQNIELEKIEDIRQDSFKENLDFLKAKVQTALKIYDESRILYHNLYNQTKELKYKYRLSIMEGLCGDLDKSIKLLEEINRKQPRRLTIIKKLAYAYDQNKDYKKAIGYFKYAQKLDPNNTQVKEKLEQYDRLM